MTEQETMLPTGWVMTTVGGVCTNLQYGYTASAVAENVGPRLLRITDIQDNQVQWPSVPYCTIDKDQIEKYSLRPGDIVFARTGGTVGKSFLINAIPEPSVFASYLIRLTSHPSMRAKYLYYFFQSASYWEQIGLKKGGLQGNVNATTLSSLNLPLCPEKEQQRIVEKIDELFSDLDKGIESLAIAQQQLFAYKRALIKHALEGRLTAKWRVANRATLESSDITLARIVRARHDKRPVTKILSADLATLPKLPDEWMYVRLSDIAEIGSGMSVSKNRKLVEPFEVPYLRVANVQRGHLVLNDIKTMMVERSLLPRLRLKKWDILFNEGGDRDKLGRGWIWENQIETCITQNHVFRASPYLPSDSHARFLSHWGNIHGQAYFDQEGKQTTNLASINRTTLSNFPVPLPSFAEQEQIIERLDAETTTLDQLETDISLSQAKLQSLRFSILDRAFSGRLVPQRSDDEHAAILLKQIEAERKPSGTNQPYDNSKKKAA